jgi:hypothetical protein
MARADELVDNPDLVFAQALGAGATDISPATDPAGASAGSPTHRSQLGDRQTRRRLATRITVDHGRTITSSR